MIQAELVFNEQGDMQAWCLTGHADSGPNGSDIVCAAVSVLAIGLVNNLERLAHHEPQVLVDDVEGGYLEVVYDSQKVSQAETKLLSQAFHETLKDIQSEYADYIKIKQREED